MIVYSHGLSQEGVVNETLLQVAQAGVYRDIRTMNLHDLRRKPAPAFNVPRAVIWLIVALVAVHLGRLYGPFSDEQIIYYFAFIPARFGADGLMAQADFYDRGARIWSLVTYSFIHADWIHLSINCFWMLAFGSIVARRLKTARFLIMSAIGSIAGALTYYAFHPGQIAVLVGASAAISAQVAVAARFMFARPTGWQWTSDYEIATMKPLSLARTFSNRRSLMFILIWLGLNYVFGASGYGTPDGEALIAWEAHLGGFAAGLLALGIVDRKSSQ
jgi:membrane associated rhomboid family serine protease